MTTQQEKFIRSRVSEDAVRKKLMQLEKREVVELYLQLRYDKQVKGEKVR